MKFYILAWTFCFRDRKLCIVTKIAKKYCIYVTSTIERIGIPIEFFAQDSRSRKFPILNSWRVRRKIANCITLEHFDPVFTTIKYMNILHSKSYYKFLQGFESRMQECS